MPDVTLASTVYDNILEPDPRLADQLSLLVVVEYRNLEIVVVGRIVNGESQFLVPVWSVSIDSQLKE